MDSTDVGSLPLEGDRDRFLRGASHAKEAKSKLNEETLRDVVYFEATVTHGLLDKLGAGLTVPTYPQFRDMNEMFLKMIGGVVKVEGGYVMAETPTVEDACIPEVYVIKNRVGEIEEAVGEPFRMRVCVTGPHTLSHLFAYRNADLFVQLSEALAKIAGGSIFRSKHGGVEVLTLDEPLLGVVDDPLLDYGSEGRDSLRDAWERIYGKAEAKGVKTCMHIHSSADPLFWDVKHLRLIEAHVDAPIYKTEKTKKLLEANDKFLVATLCHTQFDELVRAKLRQQLGRAPETTLTEKLGEIWAGIRRGKVDPTQYLEDREVMEKRLGTVVRLFGVERIPLAGPECGLGGFPTYKTAITYLNRVASVVRRFRGDGGPAGI